MRKNQRRLRRDELLIPRATSPDYGFSVVFTRTSDRTASNLKSLKGPLSIPLESGYRQERLLQSFYILRPWRIKHTGPLDRTTLKQWESLLYQCPTNCVLTYCYILYQRGNGYDESHPSPSDPRIPVSDSSRTIQKVLDGKIRFVYLLNNGGTFSDIASSSFTPRAPRHIYCDWVPLGLISTGGMKGWMAG